MNTLRAKLIALLVGAILIVVGLATWLTFLVLEKPHFPTLAIANAAQIGFMMRQLDGATLGAGKPSVPEIGLRDKPAEGIVLSRFTDDLRAALAAQGLPTDALVTRAHGSPWAMVSVVLPGRAQMLVAPVAMPSRPPDIISALLGWMVLVAMGATAVSIAAVYRLTQPLALIERSVANVGARGELPLLPETGPAEVRVTAQAINQLSSRLKQAMESRMRLVAAAGHDLRTPMTRMRLRAEFLDEPDRGKWLTDLQELNHIADSAISLVREETATETVDPVCLGELLCEVVGELAELGMDLHMGEVEAADVMIKPLSLKRALRNLLVNAATHGKGATVAMRRAGQTARIEIADRGGGIPDALLERATEPFFRADPARSAGGGAGLGLAIAQEIIQRNNGRLTLANARGGGLVQTVAFPIYRHTATRSAGVSA